MDQRKSALLQKSLEQRWDDTHGYSPEVVKVWTDHRALCCQVYSVHQLAGCRVSLDPDQASSAQRAQYVAQWDRAERLGELDPLDRKVRDSVNTLLEEGLFYGVVTHVAELGDEAFLRVRFNRGVSVLLPLAWVVLHPFRCTQLLQQEWPWALQVAQQHPEQLTVLQGGHARAVRGAARDGHGARILTERGYITESTWPNIQMVMQITWTQQPRQMQTRTSYSIGPFAQLAHERLLEVAQAPIPPAPFAQFFGDYLPWCDSAAIPPGAGLETVLIISRAVDDLGFVAAGAHADASRFAVLTADGQVHGYLQLPIGARLAINATRYEHARALAEYLRSFHPRLRWAILGGPYTEAAKQFGAFMLYAIRLGARGTSIGEGIIS